MSARIVRRTIAQPADGSDFTVTLAPPEATDDYGLTAALTTGATGVGLELIDAAPSDRTTSSFRVVTAAPLPTGSVLEFILVRA